MSEYIRKHAQAGRLYVGCEGDEPGLAFAVNQIGSEMFVYSSDFPHEVNNEICRQEIHELSTREDLATRDKENILCANAERFYGLSPAPAASGRRQAAVSAR